MGGYIIPLCLSTDTPFTPISSDSDSNSKLEDEIIVYPQAGSKLKMPGKQLKVTFVTLVSDRNYANLLILT